MDTTGARSLATPAWSPTHRVPDGGLAAWPTPDGSGPPAVTLDAALDLAVVERVNDWSRVRAFNGWLGWVDGRRLVALSGDPANAADDDTMDARWPRYSGEWRVLAGGIDGLQVGDDITVEVDDEWVSLDSDAFAVDLAVDGVRSSGDASQVRLEVADGRSILLDWWDADDGDRLADAVRASVRKADGNAMPDARPITPGVVLMWAYWGIGTLIILAAGIVLLSALGGPLRLR